MTTFHQTDPYSPMTSVSLDDLSLREIEVLTLITRGLSNQEISNEMHLSANTVKTYIRGAYRKIGAERRSQAIVWSAQRGLLDEQ